MGGWNTWLLTRIRTPLLSARILMSLAVGLSLGVLTFFGLIVLERSVQKSSPGKLSTLVRLFDRRSLSEPCGLGVLRGNFLDLVLQGADAFLVWAGTAHLRMWLDGVTHVGIQALVYLSQQFANSYALLYGLLEGESVAIVIALFVSYVGRLVRRVWMTLLVVTASASVILAASAFSMGAVQPYHWKVLLVGFECLGLTWILIHFDFLPLLSAAFTFALCW